MKLWVTDLDGEGWPERAHLVVDPAECPPNEPAAWPDVLVLACGRRVYRGQVGHGFEGHEDGCHPMASWAVHCGMTGVES